MFSSMKGFSLFWNKMNTLIKRLTLTLESTDLDIESSLLCQWKSFGSLSKLETSDNTLVAICCVL